MSLRSVNLNLLPILRALLRERNLSRAADSVGLSQPAVSAALARLRQIFDDPLLIREGRGMALTLRAHELIVPVEKICDSLEDVLGTDTFDPANCKRRFVIVCPDHPVMLVAPILIDELKRVAPNVTLHFVDTPHEELEAHTREADFLILPEFVVLEKKFRNMRWELLIKDEMVAVVSDDHAVSQIANPTKEDFLGIDFVEYYPALAWVDDAILHRFSCIDAKRRKVIARVQQLTLLPSIAAQAGVGAIAPRRIVEKMSATLPLHIINSSLFSSRLDFVLCWYANSDGDPAHRWFRKLIIEAVGKQLGTP